MSGTSRGSPAATTPSRPLALAAVAPVLAQVSRRIGPALELDAVLRIVLDAMRSLADVEGGWVCLLGADGIRVAASDPPLPGDLAGVRLPRRAGLLGDVLGSGEGQVVVDTAGDRRLDPVLQALGRPHVRSVVSVPLIWLGEVVGSIQVDSSRPGAFDDDDRRVLESLAVHAAGAVDSARRFASVAELESMKSDFIARVSHELRTPITIIAGFLSTLRANDERLGDDERRQILERIDGATTRLSTLIDQLLGLTRLQSGVLPAEVGPVAVAEALAEVQRLAARPSEVAVECPPDLTVDTDVRLLVRALGMLVDNALKYAGRCRVEARPGVIEVVDDGPGIPPAQRAVVFEPFSRSGDDGSIAGMGLGLPMARTILAAAGADLSLGEPPESGGTRVVVRFW